MGIPAPLGVGASGAPPAGDQANAVLSGLLPLVGPTQPFAFRGPMNLLLWAALTATLTTTAGSLAATVSSATGLAPGAAVNSVNVPPGTTIGAIAGTNVTLAVPPVTLRGSVSLSARQITGLESTAGLLGAVVSDGAGTFAVGTTVTGIVRVAIPAVGNVPLVPGVVEISALPLVVPVQNVEVPVTFAVNGNAIQTTGADAAASFTGAGVTFNGTVQLERSFDGGSTYVVCNVGGNGVLAQWTGAAVGPVSLAFGEPEKNMLYRLNCAVLTSVVGNGVVKYRISQTGGAAESLAIGQII